MDDTAKPAETVASNPPKNDVTTTTVPTQDNSSNAEVERLRKENEQREMRIRQLENERTDRLKLDEEAKRKQLEEQEQYKTLYEQSEAERLRLAQEREDSARQATISQAQNEIFASFPEEVTKVATDLGLTLSDTSDEAKEALKNKLSAIPTVGKKVSGNNPSPNSDTTPLDRSKLTERMRWDLRGPSDEAKRTAIGGLKALDVMREQAGVTKQ